LCPVVGVLRLFSPGISAIFLREGYAGNDTPCRVLLREEEDKDPSL
jgi:hypothetical protein